LTRGSSGRAEREMHLPIAVGEDRGRRW
jgi:hypothetical protein